MRAPGRYAGQKLTGIAELRGTAKGVPVAICASGTTLANLDVAAIPDWWIVVAVNEAIRKLSGRADYWVLSDRPIAQQYGQFVTRRTTVLAMHDAVLYTQQACPKGTKIYTTMSHAVPKAYDDGTNFYSRGTVLIGAIEMLRYLGAKKFYCFGLDCFRTEKEYYYDGRKHPLSSETKLLVTEQIVNDVPPQLRIWVTSRLKRMIIKLDETVASGLWEKCQVYCVGSPFSQQRAIPKLSDEEFAEHVARAEETRKRKERRDREQEPDGTAIADVCGAGDSAEGPDNAGGSPPAAGDSGVSGASANG